MRKIRKLDNGWFAIPRDPYETSPIVPNTIIDVTYINGEVAQKVLSHEIFWPKVLKFRTDLDLSEHSDLINEPTSSISNKQFDLFNKGEWIKFIPGDVAYWNPGDKLDIRYLNGDIHNHVSTEGINWDTVAKYRKSLASAPDQLIPPKHVHVNPSIVITPKGTEVDPNSDHIVSPPLPCPAPVRQVAPRSIPQGYKWTNPNLTYLSYVEAGWTIDELINVNFLQLVGSIEPLTTQQGTEVDPNSRYYDAGGIETIEVIKSKLTPEQLKGYLLGNIIKYSCRLNFKGSAERDAEKLKFYSNWLEQLK